MMNKYLSDKIKAVSFFLMVMVVFLHSYNIVIRMNSSVESINGGYSYFIQYFISQGIARIAVPLFFFISGYLFFLNIKGGYVYEFLFKFKKRLNSLVLPYLFWSVYGLLFFILLQLIPQSKPFFTNDLIRNYSFAHIIETIFIDPIPYQLWFVRDLIILIILSPLIYWSIRYFKQFVIIFFLMTWLCGLNYVLFSYEAVFFFSLGAFCSIQGITLQNSKLKKYYLLFTIAWFVLVLLKTCLVYTDHINNLLLDVLHKTSILFGMISIWFAYDNIFKNRDISETRFYSAFQFTFFMYVFHEPVLTTSKKLMFFIFGRTEFSSFIIYIITSVFTIFIAILVGFCLKRILPRFYYVITGSR